MDDRIIEFAAYLDSIEGVECDPEKDIREGLLNSTTIDFVIGDRDEYRVWDGNREHRALSKGSLSMEERAGTFVVTGASIHLPLYQEDEDDWQKFIDTKGRWRIREQSEGLSTATHYTSPHVELPPNENCSLTEAKRVVRETANAYRQTHDALLASREDTRTGLDAGRASREE